MAVDYGAGGLDGLTKQVPPVPLLNIALLDRLKIPANFIQDLICFLSRVLAGVQITDYTLFANAFHLLRRKLICVVKNERRLSNLSAEELFLPLQLMHGRRSHELVLLLE